MFTLAPINLDDYMTMQEVMILIGADLTSMISLLGSFRRSQHPLRVYYSGRPDVMNGELESPELVYHVDDVIAHLGRMGIDVRGKYLAGAIERGYYRYIGGLGVHDQDSDEEYVRFLKTWTPESELAISSPYDPGFLQWMLSVDTNQPSGASPYRPSLPHQNTDLREGTTG